MQFTNLLATAVVLLTVLAVVALVIKLDRRSACAYELLPGLLSPGEAAFYRALLAAVSPFPDRAEGARGRPPTLWNIAGVNLDDSGT
jgi:hypothetical protein